MPASNNVTLWLRVGGLKDDRDSIDNGQKDNDDKNNGDTNNQSTSQGCLLVLHRPARTHSIDLKIITPTIATISVLTMIVD
eukprot:14435208-Ditylum_brightwellii.AAC.1